MNKFVKNWREETKYPSSKTIPGQSLKPSELLKRHLAGTLPEIHKGKIYEYHFDEEGNRIGYPLPIEMHEFHALAVELKAKRQERANAERAEQAEKAKQAVIEEWKSKNPDWKPNPASAIIQTPQTPDKP